MGVLIAHPLLRQKKMTGTSITAAKLRAAWKSPWKEDEGSGRTVVRLEGSSCGNNHLAGAAVSEVGDRTGLLPFHLERISCSNSVGDLGPGNSKCTISYDGLKVDRSSQNQMGRSHTQWVKKP